MLRLKNRLYKRLGIQKSVNSLDYFSSLSQVVFAPIRSKAGHVIQACGDCSRRVGRSMSTETKQGQGKKNAALIVIRFPFGRV
jgi:hypothetical protein